MRNYKSVFDTTTLTFTRRQEASGHLDENDNWVEVEDTPVVATGDLQPYTKQAAMQVNAPSGFTLRNAKLFSSKDVLRTVDDYTATSADTVTIGNRKFFVGSVLDWSGSVLSTDYIDYILMLEALPDTGVIT